MQCIQLNQNLCFDLIEPEIKLAKEYVEKYNGEFYSSDDTKKNSEYETVKDNYGNIIYITPLPPPKEEQVLWKCSAEVLCRFAKKLVENEDLFAQLEFLIRGLPQHDVKKYDIFLISNYFNYYGSICSIDVPNKAGEFHIYMRNETPLCTLGIVADQLSRGNKLVIHATRNTAVICNLFVELINESGFSKGLVTVLVENENNKIAVSREGHFFFYSPSIAGSWAVVTEHADLRAALSGLLAATTAPVYPWRLRRIYVQENIYAQFKSILSEEGSPQCAPENNTKIIEQLKAKSSAVFFHNNKSVVLDYTGSPEDDIFDFSLILVEAYRTTKELLVLMNAQECNYLSLWCNDLSTANEIAFTTNISNVWINEFGKFDGPTPISPTFYEMHDFQKCNNTYSKTDINEKFVEAVRKMFKSIRNKQVNWKKLGIEKRRCVIIELLEKYKCSVDPVDDLFDGMINGFRRYHPDAIFKVENNKVCLQQNQPINNLCVLLGECKSDIISYLIEFILNGNAIVISHPQDCNMLKFLAKHSDETGIPIGRLLFDDIPESGKAWIFSRFKGINLVDLTSGFGKTSMYKPKIVYYQYGESFGN